MTIDELIDEYKKLRKRIRPEPHARHKELLRKIVELYKDCIKKDISDQAEKDMDEWIKDSLKDF